MNIPFPSLEVPCLVLSFQFHNLCHKECVSRFDLARLSLRLGPTLPCPVHPPPSPVPGRYPWPKSFMHIAPCQFQNMNGIITHALHISPIFLHNMYEWVTVHSSKYALFQSMLQQKQIRVYTLENHVTASHRIIVRQRHGHCESRHRQLHKGQCGTNQARHPRPPYSTIQTQAHIKHQSKYRCI